MIDTTPASGADLAGLTAMPALEIARAVREGKVSPVQVVQAHLAQIDRLEPQIRAFQVVLAEQALAEARVLAARPGLAGLPLAGVPVAVKDNVDVAGVPTRHGSAATPAGAARADDELVRRLRAAGCVVIGKTQMPELAIWPFTEPQAYPVTRNPWDTERTPGGSTGDGAAALASGMAALALGSDGGGSIRIPAACCGVVGLKPGPGVVPLAGGMDSHWYGLTVFGPLARTVGDIAAALDVLTETAAHATAALPDRPLRIAYFAAAAAFGARLAPPARAAVEDTAAPTALSVGNWLCTMPWNLAGLPAISVPAPNSGLPVGVQIVAPAGGENVILSIAAELERLRPWPQLAPLAAAPDTATATGVRRHEPG